MAFDQCPACASPVSATDFYCEKCGHELGTPAPAAPAERAGAGGPEVPRWVSSAGSPERCARCDGVAFGAEGFCETCGWRRPAGVDHRELDLGRLAAVTDKGKRHHNNEDAVALGVTARALVAVVCDGVSSSNRPDTASNSAVDAAVAALVTALERDEPTGDAIGRATRAAQAAAALAGGPEPGANPPSSTFVCAVVSADAVTVGWVGDSRAYWIPSTGDNGAVCLTVDDSLAGQLSAAGEHLPDGMPHGSAAALMRWLGADAPETTPHLHTFNPPGPGRVLVCSDGLFRYRPGAADLAAATPREGPLATARALVQLALDAGGQDNIAVAVLPYPPQESP